MSWMRKQIFNRENVPQPCIPKSDDKRHVLSAPDRNYHRYESPTDKPSSKLVFFVIILYILTFLNEIIQPTVIRYVNQYMLQNSLKICQLKKKILIHIEITIPNECKVKALEPGKLS